MNPALELLGEGYMQEYRIESVPIFVDSPPCDPAGRMSLSKPLYRISGAATLALEVISVVAVATREIFWY